MVEILVVEDEKSIADLVTVYLQNENFLVHTCYNGKDALSGIENHTIDLAILDVMLPDMDGFEILQIIRKNYNFPVIMLTAKEAELDKITGLTLGADDYITKPFRPLEMVARVKAQLRRYKKYNTFQEEKESVLFVRGLVLDTDKYTCHINEKEIALTPIEFSILKELLLHGGKVLSSEEIFQKVWQEKYYTNANNTVMVHIRHLREKMGDSAENPKYIKTVWGVGYTIET